MEIFIPFNTPSSKNSKQWTGKFLVNSKCVNKYKKMTIYFWINNKEVFKEMIKDKKKPYNIELEFVRDSKRKFDYINASQIIFDLMTEYKWIDDDNCDEIIPSFKEYSYNKDNSGCYIRIK